MRQACRCNQSLLRHARGERKTRGFVLKWRVCPTGYTLIQGVQLLAVDSMCIVDWGEPIVITPSKNGVIIHRLPGVRFPLDEYNACINHFMFHNLLKIENAAGVQCECHQDEER